MGKNLGKKRLSILGLRPRQTATLLSMLSSVLIMLLTLGALTVFSKQVRTAILRSDRLLQSNEEQRQRIASLKTEALRLEGQRNALQSEQNRLENAVRTTKKSAANAVADAKKRVEVARTKATQAESKLSATQGQLTTAQQAQAQAQQAQEAAQQGASAATARASQAIARASQAQQRFAQAQQRFTAAQSRLGAAQSRLGAAQSRLNATYSRLATTNKRLATTNKRLAQVGKQRREAEKKARQASGSARRAGQSAIFVGQRVVYLTAQSAQLESDNRKAQAELQEAQAQLQQAQTNVQVAKVAFDEAVRQAAQIGQTTALIDMGEVSVRWGQTFADVTIPANSDASDARALLRRLLEDGARAASEVGAAEILNPATGVTRALHLASLPLPSSSGLTELDEEAIITNFANRLATFEVPVSVRLVAARSYAKGETQMEGRLLEVPVRRVYVKGDTIAVVTLPPNEKDFQIFSDLLKLADKGAELARGKGVQPLLSAQNPNLFADDTNQRIFEAIRRIQQQNGAVSVRLVAARDVSTVDSIRVRFDIGSLS